MKFIFPVSVLHFSQNSIVMLRRRPNFPKICSVPRNIHAILVLFFAAALGHVNPIWGGNALTLSVVEQLESQFRDTYMQYYHHFHKNPEPSYKEINTARYVAEKLRAMQLDEVRERVGGHGVTALLRGGRPGPVIALRADMDALNIQEATGVDFASVNSGVMHACGHDAHTAMLLGAAHVLSTLKGELAGTVKFIFQPAEEMTPRGGALGMIEDGALEDPKVDAVIAIHVWPTYKTGEIGAQDGVVSAASDHLKIKITGKSAHASMPHEGTDAIVASAAVITALQGIISRSVDPRDTAVITIGTINGGTRYNVVPEEAFLEGTVRTFNPVITEKMPEWIKRAAENAAAAYGSCAEMDYESGYPSVVNDPDISSLCREAIVDTVREEGLLAAQKVPASGEDFSFFACAVPGCFAWLGCRPEGISPEDMPPLHNARFLPDPASLPFGVRYLSAAAIKLLERI